MGKKYVPEKIAEKLSDYYQNGWQILFDEGMQMQDDVLLDIISLGNNSAYAKDHGFAGIKTKEEFRACVPISEYSDYRKYIDANMQNDNGQLTSLETEYYLLSTGMSNSGKIYAENRLGEQARQLTIRLDAKMEVLEHPAIILLRMKPSLKSSPTKRLTKAATTIP